MPWRLRQGHWRRPSAPPRPRQSVRQPRLPGRDPLPRHRKLAGLRPRAGRERLRRALHSGLEGEPVMGPPLRHHRGVAPGAPRLPADLQPVLDHRAARLQDARSGPGRASHGPAHGRLSAERCLRIVDRYRVEIVRKAIQWPARQIAENAGLDGAVVVGKLLESDDANWGFDAQANEYGDLVGRGVIDPAKVVRTALQDASSVAGLLITTEAMVAEKPKKESPMPAGGPGGGGMGGMGGMGDMDF